MRLEILKNELRSLSSNMRSNLNLEVITTVARSSLGPNCPLVISSVHVCDYVAPVRPVDRLAITHTWVCDHAISRSELLKPKEYSHSPSPPPPSSPRSSMSYSLLEEFILEDPPPPKIQEYHRRRLLSQWCCIDSALGGHLFFLLLVSHLDLKRHSARK